MSGFDSYRVRERADTARLVVAGAFLVLAGAFFRTQVLQHDEFQHQGEKTRLRRIPVAAPRGMILDRHGQVIAENVPGYSVKLIAPSSDSLRAVLRRMQAIVPLDSARQAEVLGRYLDAKYEPAVVFGDATFETVARLEEHRAALPGLVIQAEPKRFYPAGPAVAHLVGYVGEVTQADLAAKRFPGAGRGSVVGKVGLERQYDEVLRGDEGLRYIEVNARGRVVREEVASASLPPTPGKPIHTTIDLDLQRFVDSIWPAGVRGSLVALSPEGEVLALYSAPSYDPNAFLGGISPALLRQLNTDEARPLYDRALQARYPPASTFKLAIAAMALKRGLVTLDTRMPRPCTGGYQFGNRRFGCWKKEGHGNVTLAEAIAGSCDVYFYQLGLQLGLDVILDEGGEMGLRTSTGIDLGSETSPILPSPAYFERHYGHNWSRSAAALNISIGQGENTQTPINMVSFYQALVTDGVKHPPYVVRPSRSVAARPLGLSAEARDELRQALVGVVKQGTAARSYHADLETGGKTGTAQNPHGDDHGWYIGFAPADRPQIIVGGVMEFAKHGTTVAPYVVSVLRRYVLGPTVPQPAQPVGVTAAQDTAPRVLELPSGAPSARAAAPARRDSGRAGR